MPFSCRAHAVPLPCRAAKGLECVFPTWFTQCGRVWFTLAMPCSDHAVLLKATAWSEHGMASVNQTRPHCVNQVGNTHSKPLAARHGRGTACYVWIGLKSSIIWNILLPQILPVLSEENGEHFPRLRVSRLRFEPWISGISSNSDVLLPLHRSRVIQLPFSSYMSYRHSLNKTGNVYILVTWHWGTFA